MNTANQQRRVALVTGANKGIGLETARQLARDHGFTVLMGARDRTRGQDAEDALRAEGLDVHLLLLDPTDAASVERARAEVDERFGRLDVLVNNAGGLVQDDLAAPATVPTQALRDTFELNVFAVHDVTRAFWPLLERSDAARLVNVSSMAGSLAAQSDFDGPMKNYHFVAYASSKAALNMMTVNVASQWEGTPHRANAAHPGSVRTEANPDGEISVEDGARTSVELATIPGDGPNGTFSYLGETMPW